MSVAARIRPNLLQSTSVDEPVQSLDCAKVIESPPNENSEALVKLKAQIDSAENLKEFVSIIELAVWRDELSRAVLKLASMKDERTTIFGFDTEQATPTMSQIGSLRSLIGRLNLDGSNKTTVIEWLKHLKITRNRADKWKAGFGVIEDLFSHGQGRPCLGKTDEILGCPPNSNFRRNKLEEPTLVRSREIAF